MDTQQWVEREVAELHGFFVEWFNGTCPGDDATFEARLASHLADDLLCIMPSGATFTRGRLLERMRPGHGQNPDFRIEVRDIEVRHEDTHCVLATYVERQIGARNSEHSDNTRLTTVLFVRNSGHPQWKHIHETWLPRAG